MAEYKIIRKMYRSVKDIECGNPYRTVDLGFKPLTKLEAEIVLTKLMTNELWINQIVQF